MMRTFSLAGVSVLATFLLSGGVAIAQDDAAATQAEAEAEAKAKLPKKGDFDAGGQVRLPSGPDEQGQYATFNWIALDAGGRYYLTDWFSVTGSAPLAVYKPDDFMGVDPKLIGGISATLDLRMPKMPFGPRAEDTEVGLLLSGAYMREGAMLLSPKDFPLFVGDFKPGFTAGLRTRIKLSSLLDFSLNPLYVQQAGSEESLMAVQIPMSLIVGLADFLKVSADLGIYTGDDFSFSGDDGGRIATGAAIDVKIGPIVAHAGAGVATLLTGGLYPSISDSVYVDLNVKFAK